MKKYRQILIFAICSLVCAGVRGQEIDTATRLRLAQSFEQSGDWDRAVAYVRFEDISHFDVMVGYRTIVSTI